MVAAVSERKQVFNDAASSGDKGGVSRVFTRPASGAFVIIPNAVRPTVTRSPLDGSSTRCCVIMAAFSLRRNGKASSLLAERVLIPPLAPGLDLSPRLASEKAIHLARRKNPRAGRFAITVAEMCQPGQQPHGEERDRRPKRPARFSDKTAAAGPKDPIHFRHGPTTVGQDREKTRRDEDIERIVLMREFQNVVAFESAVVELERISFLLGPT